MSEAASTPSGKYDSARAKELLGQLYSEPDAAKRAQLAVDIQQQIIDDEAMGFLAILNKTTVMRAKVINCREKNPISFYFLNSETDITD